MNERIRQLAEQAFTITTDGKIGHVNNYMVEKFAKLIVQECAMFVVTELEGKVGSRIADATANRLEEHFGVEQ
jgi:hypothetical protein